MAIASIENISAWNYNLNRLIQNGAPRKSLKELGKDIHRKEFEKCGEWETYITSSEFYCALGRDDIERFSKFIRPFFGEIEVIATIQDLRRVIDAHCAWSIFNQGPDIHHLLSGFSLTHFDYPKAFENWKEILAPSKISILNYSPIRSRNGDIVSELISKILGPNVQPPLTNTRSNPTPNKFGIEALRCVRKASVSNDRFKKIRTEITKHFSEEPRWRVDESTWEKFRLEAYRITDETNKRWLNSENKLEFSGGNDSKERHRVRTRLWRCDRPQRHHPRAKLGLRRPQRRTVTTSNLVVRPIFTIKIYDMAERPLKFCSFIKKAARKQFIKSSGPSSKIHKHFYKRYLDPRIFLSASPTNILADLILNEQRHLSDRKPAE